MAQFTIYHNPRCSKSRQTLEILQQKQSDIEIIEYLKTPPTASELQQVIAALSLTPQDIMRKREAEYKQSGLDNPDLTTAQQIELMVANPKVIERPIVTNGDKAIVGRPPENVLNLF